MSYLTIVAMSKYTARIDTLWKWAGLCAVWLLVPPTGRNALYTVLAVVTKRSGGQKQEEALRLLFSRVLALPLMYPEFKQ